ncbi:disulfide oxidoreductase [Neobacillus sp. LXY-4]|uniref:disulfide oxidoreductase n=1 Tax=Neobacillus sp. LXY-4 TaxID=3379826 RepID=UPI003EDEA1D8
MSPNRSVLYLYFAWIVAVVATLGSLYFSEIRLFQPCVLCWYQRIEMYPLSVILGIAAFTSDIKITKYVLPFSIVGGLTSLYHYLLEKVPGFAPIKPCAQGIPCDYPWINWLGFITIPFLALVAFIMISVLLILVNRRNK